MYFRTSLGALCKALGPWLLIRLSRCTRAYRHFSDRMIEIRKNVGRPLCIAKAGSEAVGTSTFAILIARDEKEQNRMMLHHTEQ